MAKWTEQTDQRFRKAGFLDPKTKMAKLRAALPTIEAALSNGFTYEQCIEQLAQSGLKMSLPYFKLALFRARKLGAINTHVSVDVEGRNKNDKSDDRTEQSEPKESRVVSASGATIVTKKVKGTVISTVEKKDHLTNREPRLEDFL
jgi:hypothetical protein